MAAAATAVSILRRGSRWLHRLAWGVFVIALLVVVVTIRVPRIDAGDVFQDGTLRIAVDPGLPPFAFFDSAGELYGLEVDLGRTIAAELGLEARLHPTGFDAVYDLVTSHTVDIAVALVRVNPLRMGEVFYTRPYFNAGLVLVTIPETGIQSMADLGGRSLAYAFGSEADTEARRWLRRIAAFETRPYERPEYALDAVRLGEANAGLVDALTALLYLRDHPTWSGRIVADVTVDPVAIIVSLERSDAWRLVDGALGRILARGQFNAMLDEWVQGG